MVITLRVSLYPNRTLGDRIKKWRLEQGFLQRDLAKIIGVSEMTIVNWEKGRTKPDLKIGICGEHGDHPESVQFNHSIGLSYVSCSVSRLPIERLATAHAKLKEKDKKSPEKYDPNTSFSIFF